MTSRSRLLLLLLAIGSLAASLTMLAQPAVRFSTYEPNLCSIGADGAGNIYAACVNFTTKTSSLVRFASSEAPAWSEYADMAPNLGFADWRNEITGP